MSTLSRQAVINRRLPFVIGFLILISAALLFAVSRYQWLPPDVQREFVLRGRDNVSSVRRLPAERGIIYDRGGIPLAFNTIEYEIGVSPNLITSDRRIEVARQLALILQRDEYDLLRRISRPTQWELIARPVSAEVGQRIADLNLFGVVINPLSRRLYPQQALLGPVLGFVIEDGDKTRGAIGVEGSYNSQLAGQALRQEVRTVPFDLPTEQRELGQRGMSLVLTIDRDIQFWVEEELRQAVERYQATGGTIIVMNPRNGDILAMASYPTYDPNRFTEVRNPRDLNNPAISQVYEPGSTFKVLTVAAALEMGVIGPNWTYNDQGSLLVGGITVQNWDRQAHGLTDATQALVQSLNVGLATIALEMGPTEFYSRIRAFGIGQPTRVDLPGEEAGILKVPGDPDWSESNLATNSYGQGLSVTPLQLLTAVNAIANDGLMMQPRIVTQMIDGQNVIDSQPSAMRRAVSQQTAQTVTQMMVQIINDPNGSPKAALPGYTVAGKTGTAEIPSPMGYERGPTSSIASFVGFLPADDPQISVLVKLDRPVGYWGNETAAPLFRRLAERLVLLLDIPTDEIRARLRAGGGQVGD
ncbi:MAG: penicillin-binding protein 2 [Anaerolineae bacterium]|nr:penicillin-binding protein 2 [Anaerolineae bacterium]